MVHGRLYLSLPLCLLQAQAGHLARLLLALLGPLGALHRLAATPLLAQHTPLAVPTGNKWHGRPVDLVAKELSNRAGRALP